MRRPRFPALIEDGEDALTIGRILFYSFLAVVWLGVISGLALGVAHRLFVLIGGI